jgi:DNA-binding PadR family transcriptional regulator
MFFGKRFSGYHRKQLSGLEILVLSIIRKNDHKITGYEIIQTINEKFGRMWKASAGTIYPLLNRLAEMDFVAIEEIMDDNNRFKKLYSITNKGITELESVLNHNLPSSIQALGNYISTLFEASNPDRETLEKVACCFSFPFSDFHIDKRIHQRSRDIINNINKVKWYLERLEITKDSLETRLKEVEHRIIHYSKILKELERIKKEQSTEIPIVDEEEYDKPFK